MLHYQSVLWKLKVTNDVSISGGSGIFCFIDFCTILIMVFSFCCTVYGKVRPMAWFFMANVTIPNLSTVMFYYQTEVLNLEAAFLGTSRVVGWVGLMLGTFIYNRYLKKVKLRIILM